MRVSKIPKKPKNYLIKVPLYQMHSDQPEHNISQSIYLSNTNINNQYKNDVIRLFA